MKKHLTSPKMMAATLTATIMLTGTLLTAEARDKGNQKIRRQETRTEQRDVRKAPKQTPRKVAHKKQTTHVTKVVTHVPNRTRYIKRLPANYRTVRVDGNNYYCHNGTYYRHSHLGYEIVRTPRMYHLPRHARRVIINRVPYYVCGGVYYTHHYGYYEVCEAPIVESRITLSAGPLSITFTDYDY